MKKYCFISAGEFSGDLLGAELISELKKIDGNLEFVGICGAAMEIAGALPLVKQEAVTVLGVVEIFRRLPALYEAEQKILAWIDRFQPCMAILIDFPGFHFILAEKLRLRGIPVFQYVAPKLWAWGAQRAALLRQNVTLTLGIFPFETAFFQKHQVPFVYVGSPILDRVQNSSLQKNNLGYSEKDIVVAVLLGSRKEEIEQLAFICKEIIEKIEHEEPNSRFIVVVSQNLSLNWVKNKLTLCENNVQFLQGKSLEVMAISDVAIVCSGTATLECALLGTPLCVLYRMHALSFQLAKRKVKIPWISLVNILAQRELVKEFIQDIDADSVVIEILDLIRNSKRRAEIKNEFLQLKASLQPDAAAHAARIILQHVSI